MTPPTSGHKPPSLLALGGMFVRHANATLGGGSATIAVLRAQIVDRRRWTTEVEFRLAYALSRLTPGTNVLAFCTAVGWMTRRGPGALVALLAASIPCSVIALVATHFFEVWHQQPMFRAALKGALAAAVAIMGNTAWVLAVPYARAVPARALAIVVLAIALVSFTPMSPFQVLLLAALGGALWPAKEKRE